jgi:uncharacterized protein
VSVEQRQRLVRAVLDLNIIISASIVPLGPAFAVWNSWLAGQFHGCISAGMLFELAGKLARPRIARRYRITPEDVRVTDALLRRKCFLVDVPDSEVRPITGDPEDDLVLATARLGQAAYLVTRDRRLLSLDSYEGTAIVDPSDFLRILGRSPQ